MFPTWIPFRLPYLELSIFCSEGEPYDTIGESATKRRVSSTECEGERVYNPLESGKKCRCDGDCRVAEDALAD